MKKSKRRAPSKRLTPLEKRILNDILKSLSGPKRPKKRKGSAKKGKKRASSAQRGASTTSLRSIRGASRIIHPYYGDVTEYVQKSSHTCPKCGSQMRYLHASGSTDYFYCPMCERWLAASKMAQSYDDDDDKKSLNAARAQRKSLAVAYG